MQRHMIGTALATRKGACDLLRIGIDPISTPVEYTEVGSDLNGIPIEAGFGTTVWTWDVMTQEDYDVLLQLQGDTAGATMYIRTTKRAGTSGITFANFQGIAKRPVFDHREGLLCYGVKIEFVQLV